MTNRRPQVAAAAAVFLLGLLVAGAGCELTSLPIIIDGTALAETLRIDSDPPFPPVILGSASADLDMLLGSLDIADSVHLYDLSIEFADNTTDTAATLTGMLLMQRPGSAQRDTIVVLNGSRIADFSRERSIFTTAVAGYRYNPRGVGALAQLLRGPQPLPTVMFTVQAVADKPSLHFTIRVKVSAQVFTSP